MANVHERWPAANAGDDDDKRDSDDWPTASLHPTLRLIFVPQVLSVMASVVACDERYSGNSIEIPCEV